MFDHTASDIQHSAMEGIIEAKSNHTHTIINLHGRDSTVTGYSGEFFESEDSSKQTFFQFSTIKWVFPNAPTIRSERFNTPLSQWFDMWSTDDPSERSDEQTSQLRDSVARIKEIVEREADVIGMDKVILCGISQGAATALMAFLEIDKPLCAFVGFSTWLPNLAKQMTVKQPVTTPVFLAHCQDDKVIDIKHGETLKAHLVDLNMPVEFHSYAKGDHWLSEPEGIDDLVKFLQKVMA